MWPKFGNSAVSMREVIIILILWGFDQKNNFFWGVILVQVNYLGLALGMSLKSYASVAKGLKLKVRKFWELIPKFVEVTREKLVGGLFAPIPHSE